MPKSWREKAARLAAMSWDEVRTRLRQEAAKRSDRLLYAVGFDPASRELNLLNGRVKTRSTLPSGPSTEAPPQTSGRFFFETRDVPQILTLLRQRFPRECEETMERAERICRHQFDVLGFERLDYGPVIDWRLDPVSGKRAPLRPWYQIHYLDFAEVGDHKITWEINRHQHLLTLAKAHLLTRENRYLSELIDEWRAWQKENPYPEGINWASSLEVAFRSLAWLWAGRLLAASSAAPKSFQGELTRALALNARHIESYLSTYSSPNTHLLGEAVALFFIGTLSPRLRSAPRWQKLGWRIILEESAKQVQADGMHFEQSVYYHVYALDFFLHARILAARNGFAIPEAFDAAIERMLGALAGISQAGAAPRFGDDDGGRVFDPRRNRREHMLDPLSTGAVLYTWANLRAASGGLKEETLWLLGPQAARQFEELDAPFAPAVSVALPASGFYVMANSNQETALDGKRGNAGRTRSEFALASARQQLVIDAGRQGAGNSGHGHADALSAQLSVDGEEWLTDPGTFRYVSPVSGIGSDRDRYRGTAAHNTLIVDGQSQAEPVGPFAWDALPPAHAELWVAGRGFDLFCGKHRGYQRLTHPVVHSRWVFYLKSRFWLVRDVAEGEGEHDLEIPWHFAPGFTASYTPPGFTLMHGANSVSQGGLALVPPEGHGWSQEVRRGYVSQAYGVEESASVVRFATRTRGPADFTVVLQPVASVPERLGKLTRTVAGKATAYRYDTGRSQHIFLFSDGSCPWTLEPWTSDARFVYLSIEGRALQFALCGGSFVGIQGQRLLSCDRQVERCEMIAPELLCSDPQAVIDVHEGNLQSALDEIAGRR